MKKTLTAALALTAFASIAFADKATINTDPAGCIEKTSQGFVCDPFLSFTPNSPVTLSDIDGTNISDKAAGCLRVISADAKVKFHAYWKDGAGWYTAPNGGGGCSNSYELARGESIQFYGSGSIVISGLLTNDDVPPYTVYERNNFFGNPSASAKPLSAFVIGGTFNPEKDYVLIGSTKYVLYNGHWFTSADYRAGKVSSDDRKDNLQIASGDGIVLFVQPRTGRARALSQGRPTSVTLPGSY